MNLNDATLNTPVNAAMFYSNMINRIGDNPTFGSLTAYIGGWIDSTLASTGQMSNGQNASRTSVSAASAGTGARRGRPPNSARTSSSTSTANNTALTTDQTKVLQAVKNQPGINHDQLKTASGVTGRAALAPVIRSLIGRGLIAGDKSAYRPANSSAATSINTAPKARRARATAGTGRGRRTATAGTETQAATGTSG